MIKDTGITRKVDELGRIALPLDTRKLLGIEQEDNVTILVDREKEQIVLKKETR